tara:strand:+ start:512 stop:1063 length:552 start_codon:yes stop_codon:yes gene_type:complete
MFNKVSLVEQSILSTKISKVVPVNYDKININILENYYYNNVQNSSEFSYLNSYYNLDYDKNIIWIGDFIRDHYRLKQKKTPLLTHKAAIIIPQGHQINYHHHIDDYDLENNSSDISAIVITKVGEKSNYIEFEYEQGRKRHMKYRIPLEQKEVIIFNSELRHAFTKNYNHEPTLLLSFKFQLV